jgi:hypothetical protein
MADDYTRWEYVVPHSNDESQPLTRRLRVPGGWLYQTLTRYLGPGKPADWERAVFCGTPYEAVH